MPFSLRVHCAGVNLYAPCAGADCNREGIAPGALDYEFLVHLPDGYRTNSRWTYLDFVFDAGQRAQLCLNDNAALMGILYDLTW